MTLNFKRLKGTEIVTAIITAAVFAGQSASASTWGAWTATGSGCNAGNVQVLPSGGALAVLFNALSISLPAGNPFQRKGRKDCTFRIQVQPPPGAYLSSIKQLYMGGVLKSARAEAEIEIDYRVGSLSRSKEIEFDDDDPISTADPKSQFTVTYTDSVKPPRRCGEKLDYVIRLKLDAEKDERVDFIDVGLDSVDVTTGGPSLCMIPQWAPCPRQR